MRVRNFTLLWTAAFAGAIYLLAWIGWYDGWSWVVGPDDTALDVTYRFGVAHPGWVATWHAVCDAFSPLAFRVLALGVIVWVLVRRRWRIAIFLFTSVELSAVVTEVLKYLADRPRPATAMVDATSTSFPSGHALGTVVAVLALWTLFLPLMAPGWRGRFIGVGVAIVVVVGVGRVVLNVHHPSDVVAGWAFGYLYFVGCLVVLRPAGVRAADEIPAGPGSAP